jgi:hypothetical protein
VDIRDRPEAAWSVGCACELKPYWLRLNNWNHGFAFVELGERRRVLRVEPAGLAGEGDLMAVKRVIFVGHGRAGKDTACEHFAAVTGLRNAGTTSKYLCEYVAAKLGLPPDVAYARRHESDRMRIFWYDAGNELRAGGPATLVRMAFEHGEITGGLRDGAELEAVRAEGLADLIVWVANDRVPVDPTVKFDERHCDIVVPNHGTLAEFRGRLDRLARFAGLFKESP